jgi:translation elongation factor EF-Tu-like GTPase
MGFRLDVQDVFSITGRGTVVTGLVASGQVSVGDRVTLVRGDGSRRVITVVGVEAFQKVLTTAETGEQVGLLLDEVERADVAAGDVLES